MVVAAADWSVVVVAVDWSVVVVAVDWSVAVVNAVVNGEASADDEAYVGVVEASAAVEAAADPI